MRTIPCVLVLVGSALLSGSGLTRAADPQSPNLDEALKKSAERIQPDAKLVRVTKDYDVWVDPKAKIVVVDGEVCLREGPLEMFACPKQTKEHESIVSVNSKAQFVHAALLAVGAKEGKPVQFRPEYVPASGTTVDVFVQWKDEAGNTQRVPAQRWVKHLKTGAPLQYPWVFAGSGFWVDERTGERHYEAETGDMICVSNFPTAMLDLPVQSSQDNAQLVFAANTENIPPIGTKVRLYLVPRLDEKPVSNAEQDQEKARRNAN